MSQGGAEECLSAQDVEGTGWLPVRTVMAKGICTLFRCLISGNRIAERAMAVELLCVQNVMGVVMLEALKELLPPQRTVLCSS